MLLSNLKTFRNHDNTYIYHFYRVVYTSIVKNRDKQFVFFLKDNSTHNNLCGKIKYKNKKKLSGGFLMIRIFPSVKSYYFFLIKKKTKQ